MLFIILALLSGGPISKFDAKPPSIYESKRQIGEVERCLIDLPHYGPPAVYRQPDRPDAATILWSSGSGTAIGRVDLLRIAAGTRITSWFDEDRVKACLA